MFSNTPAAGSKFFVDYYNRMHDQRPWLKAPNAEAQRLAGSYDYYNQEFLPHQFDKIPKGTVGPGGAKFGEYAYSDASKKIAATPGAGLWAMGIDPNSPDAERQAQAFIDNNTNRQYEGLRMTAGNWGRADAELPNLLKLKQQNPNLTATQLLDYQSRGGHMQAALPPRSFDIGDILVPVGEVALGFLGGPAWGPALAAGLGGGYGLANNGLVGGILGAAGGYGGGNFGADIGASGLGGALSNQVSGITNFLKPGGISSGLPSSLTPANLGGTAVNVLGSVPQNWATSPTTANYALPMAAFGAQAAGALKPSAPTPSRPVIPVTPPVELTSNRPVSGGIMGPFAPSPAVARPTTSITPAASPFNLSPAVLANIQSRFGAPTTVQRPMTPTTAIPRLPVKPMAAGGMLPTSKTEMNPMGGAPAAAYGLASFGRGPDSTLVHMSPREVGALQQLAQRHGGSLTTNPATGLPEAGFLDSILPAIVGIGSVLAAPFTGGGSLAAFLSNPLYMGLTAGGLAGIASGFNPREMLKWGLGVGGGAGLGQGLMGLAPGAAGGAPIVNGAVGTAGAGVGAGAGAGAVGAGGLTTAQGAGAGAALAPTVSSTGAAAAGVNAAPTFAQNVANLGSGTMEALKGNWGGFSPGMGNLVGTGGRGLAGAMGAAVLAPMALTPPDPLKLQQNPWGNAGQSQEAYGGPYIWTGGPNGQLERMSGGPPVYDIPSYGVRPSAAYPYGYAAGGVAELAQDDVMKKGGYLDGPGDGMSDSIPATIEDKQPARLADGEFVVPADVVSHIGNGSSKAGAKRLYAMMDKIRHARTGTTKQGKEINPDKYLPA